MKRSIRGGVLLALLALGLTVGAFGPRADADHSPGFVSLSAGSNLIVYLGPTTEVRDALSGAEGYITNIWSYEAAGQEWLLWSPQLPDALQGFSQIMYGQAYFVTTSADVQWTYGDLAEPPPHSADVSLQVGNNLVSFFGQSGPVQDALGAAVALTNSVWSFDSATQQWALWSPELPTALLGFADLRDGQAYFLVASETGVWEGADSLLDDGSESEERDGTTVRVIAGGIGYDSLGVPREVNISLRNDSGVPIDFLELEFSWSWNSVS